MTDEEIYERAVDAIASSQVAVIRRTPGEPGDLVGAVEAANILGVERTRVARYVKTGVMPPPIATLRATRVWLRQDVEDLADQRRANQPNSALRRPRKAR